MQFRLSACALAALAVTYAPAQALVIKPTDDAFALANTLFLNTDLIASDPVFSGFSGQGGTYTNLAGTYGLPNAGIVLSSGNVIDYGTGPNTQTGFTTAFSSPATEDQEALLQPITGIGAHFDAAQLDIEFFAPTAAEQVSFFAVFGSDEFPEFVGGGVTDGFGLFVNGENVAGVLQSGGVPGDPLLPVNIDHPDFIDLDRAVFEGTELDGVLAPNGNPVLRFDVPVNPAESNTFTIIIADAGDDVVDSTVYLSSFFSEGIQGGGGDEAVLGTSEIFPILPANPADPETGGFEIVIPDDVPVGETIWIDPPVAVGYTFEVDGSTFNTFTAPSLATVADLDGYIIRVGGDSEMIAAGQTIDFLALFGVNPTFFTLDGIDPTLMLDPLNELAFPAGVSFTTTTSGVTVTQTPISVEIDPMTPVPLPASAMLYLGGLAVLGAAGLRRRRRAA